MRGTSRALVAGAALVMLLSLPFGPASVMAADNLETLAVLWARSDGHNATMWSVRWSPDGSMISGAFFDNTTVVWNSTTGERIMKLGSHANSTREPRTRCDGNQTCLIPEHVPTRTTAWSPDGRFLAIGGDVMDIYVFNTTNWQLDGVLRGHEGGVITLDFSPDGSLLASGSGKDKISGHGAEENMIKIWDFRTRTVLANLTGHKDCIMEVKWSPDGKWLVSASDDKTLKLWDAATWRNTVNFTGLAGGVLSVDWSPDQKTLVSGSRAYNIRLWNASTGQPIVTWQTPNCVRSVDYHQEMPIILTSGVSDQMIMVRNSTTGAVLRTLDENRGPAGPVGSIMSARWSPDGKMMAAASGKEETVRVYAFGLASPPSQPLIPEWLVGVLLFIAGIILATVVTALILSRRTRRIERR